MSITITSLISREAFELKLRMSHSCTRHGSAEKHPSAYLRVRENDEEWGVEGERMEA